jgi:threonine synthase
LLVDYDIKELKKLLKPEHLQNRKADLWRYHELLPVQDRKNIVSLGEGMTPLIPVPKIGLDMGIPHLHMKDDGCAIAVDDQTMLEEQENVAKTEGAFVCPEGAATFAADRSLRENGWIGEKEKVVVLNTGAGIKYPDSVNIDVPTLQPEDRL